MAHHSHLATLCIDGEEVELVRKRGKFHTLLAFERMAERAVRERGAHVSGLECDRFNAAVSQTIAIWDKSPAKLGASTVVMLGLGQDDRPAPASVKIEREL
jgi:hypothetical protein